MLELVRGQAEQVRRGRERSQFESVSLDGSDFDQISQELIQSEIRKKKKG